MNIPIYHLALIPTYMATSEGVGFFYIVFHKKASERCDACYIKKLFDLSMLGREYNIFFCFPACLDRAAQIKAEPVPATNRKNAQPNLQCPSL